MIPRAIARWQSELAAALTRPEELLARLGLDPATLALWTASWTIPSERQVACDLPIPNLPQLRGAFLAVQALLLEPGSGLRLSNAWTEAAIQ